MFCGDFQNPYVICIVICINVIYITLIPIYICMNR